MESRRGAFLQGIKRTTRLYLKSKIGVIGAAIILFFIVLAALAPYIAHPNPVAATNLGAPFSVPAWARIFPQYSNLAVTGYPIPGVDLGMATNDATWTITGPPNVTVSHSTSSVVPKVVERIDPYNPTGSLEVNASLVGAGTPPNPSNLFNGSVVLFSMTQTFNYDQSPPKSFTVNMTLEPVSFQNVSKIYVDVILSTPTRNYTLTTAKIASTIISEEVTLSKTGTWYTINLVSGLLPQSGIPPFQTTTNPGTTVFAVKGTYSLTYAILAVPSGKDPAVSVRVLSANLKVIGGAYGLLGTDWEGRDLWSEFVYGSRISLEIGILSGIGSVLLGTFLGIAAGYLGGFWDEVLGRITDFVLVLPFLPLLIILTLILSLNAVLLKTVEVWEIAIFVIISWPTIAKIIRSQVLSVKERPYVEASRAMGGGTGHVLRKHIFPNVTALVYSQVALAVSGFILLEAALDFLTVSLYPFTTITWGIMLTQSLPYATGDPAASYVWWWFLPPGIAIAVLSLAFVLVGFALDSVFNPRLRAR